MSEVKTSTLFKFLAVATVVFATLMGIGALLHDPNHPCCKADHSWFQEWHK